MVHQPSTLNSQPGRHANGQRRFDFGPLAVAPLWSINGVMGILRRDADDVLDLIIDRKLPWAWNIASTENRAEWRIWSDCVRAYQLNTDLPITDHSAVITRLLGHTRAVLRGSEIRSVWTCDAQMVPRHIRLGNLELDPARNAARDPRNTSPFITRASFEKFMYARCNNLCRAGHSTLNSQPSTAV